MVQHSRHSKEETLGEEAQTDAGADTGLWANERRRS